MAKVYLEHIVCNVAVLFQAWHAFADLQVYPSVGCDLEEFILGGDFFSEYCQAYFRILVLPHRGIVIKILNIQSDEAGTGGGDGAVQKAFSRRQSGAVGCCVTREVQPVYSNGDTDAMRLGLLGSDAGIKS